MVLNILARGSRLVLARTQAPASSSSSLTSSAFTATLSTLSISTSSSHSIHSQTAQLYTPPSTQPHNVLNSSQSTRHMSTFGLRTSAATRWTRMAKPKAAAGKKGKKGDGKATSNLVAKKEGDPLDFEFLKVFKEQELPTEQSDDAYPEWLMQVGKPQLSLFQLKKRNYNELTEAEKVRLLRLSQRQRCKDNNQKTLE